MIEHPSHQTVQLLRDLLKELKSLRKDLKKKEYAHDLLESLDNIERIAYRCNSSRKSKLLDDIECIDT